MQDLNEKHAAPLMLVRASLLFSKSSLNFHFTGAGSMRRVWAILVPPPRAAARPNRIAATRWYLRAVLFVDMSVYPNERPASYPVIVLAIYFAVNGHICAAFGRGPQLPFVTWLAQKLRKKVAGNACRRAL
jgi:hypothetical protein